MEEAEEEEKKENGNGEAPANGTAVCTRGGFPSRPCEAFVTVFELMVQVLGDSQQAHPLPCCCAGCALCLGL